MGKAANSIGFACWDARRPYLEAGEELGEHLGLHNHLGQINAVLCDLSQRAANLGPTKRWGVYTVMGSLYCQVCKIAVQKRTAHACALK